MNARTITTWVDLGRRTVMRDVRLRCCTGDLDERLADIVAAKAGLGAAGLGEFDPALCTYTADGEEECTGCHRPTKPGAPLYWLGTSYEYPDEGDIYCSRSCARRIHLPAAGEPYDFLGRMGWGLEMLWEDWLWVKRRNEDGDVDDPPIIAIQYDETWRRDYTRAWHLSRIMRGRRRKALLRRAGTA